MRAEAADASVAESAAALRPCRSGEGVGPPRYRHARAVLCRYCTYAICMPCYAEVGAWREQGGQRSDTGECCHLCKNGPLVRDEVLLHEWVCEGPFPPRRVQRGAGIGYDDDTLQRYYYLKDVWEARQRSAAALAGRCHGSYPPAAPSPSTPADPAAALFCLTEDVGADALGRDGAGGTHSLPRTRRVSCEEGGSFVFSVHNPRLTQPCVWCAVSILPCDAHGPPGHHSGIGGGGAAAPRRGVAPVAEWACPPSLPGLPDARFRLHVPYGAFDLLNAHVLALFLADDLVAKPGGHESGASAEAAAVMDSPAVGVPSPATPVPTASPGNRTLLTVESLTLRDDAELAGRKRPRPRPSAPLGARRASGGPLLVVHIAHRIASSALEPQRLHPILRPLALKTRTTTTATGAPPPSPSHHDILTATADRGTTVCTHWRWRSPELLLAVDHLLSGRHVAVCGLGSPHFFLSLVSHAAEFQDMGVTVLDGGATTDRASATATRGAVAAQPPPRGPGAVLRRLERKLREEGVRDAHEALRRCWGNAREEAVRGQPWRVAQRALRSAGANATADGATPPKRKQQAGDTPPLAVVGWSPSPAPQPPRSVTVSPTPVARGASHPEAAGGGQRSTSVLEPGRDGSSVPPPPRQPSVLLVGEHQPYRGSVGDTLQRYRQLFPVPTDRDGVAPPPTPASPGRPAGGTPLSATWDLNFPALEIVERPLPAAWRTSPSPVGHHPTEDATAHEVGPAAAGSAATFFLPEETCVAPAFLFPRELLQQCSGGSGEGQCVLWGRDLDAAAPATPYVPPSLREHVQHADDLHALAVAAPGAPVRPPLGRPPRSRQPPCHLLVIHAADRLGLPVLQQLQRLVAVTNGVGGDPPRGTLVDENAAHLTCRPRRLVVLCSFDDPEWFAQADANPAPATAWPSREGCTGPSWPGARGTLSTFFETLAFAVIVLGSFAHVCVPRSLGGSDDALPLGALRAVATVERPSQEAHPALVPAESVLLPLALASARLALLPRHHEARHLTALSLYLQHEPGLGKGRASGAASGAEAARGALAKLPASLPRQDTIRRVLVSLPPNFSELLRVMLEVQEAVGEGVYVPVSYFLFQFAERVQQLDAYDGDDASSDLDRAKRRELRAILSVTESRMRAVQRELTSNNLAVYDPSEHRLLLPQPHRVKQLLLDVVNEREARRLPVERSDIA